MVRIRAGLIGVPAAARAEFDRQATQNLQTALRLNFHESLYASARMDGDRCTVTVEGSIYRTADASGHDGMQTVVRQACTASYRFLRDGVRRNLPGGGLEVRLHDLAGRELFSDRVGGPALSERRLPQPARAYSVVDHYIWRCSEIGGLGEKAIVATHRVADLEPALRAWMAVNARDKRVCLRFEAYLTQQSYATRRPDIQYTNNPNSGYEGWMTAQGREHVLHP